MVGKISTWEAKGALGYGEEGFTSVCHWGFSCYGASDEFESSSAYHFWCLEILCWFGLGWFSVATNSTQHGLQIQGKALSVWFYIGTTLVRVLPHAYDLYRTQTASHHQLEESYIYASPVADFYSTSWDVIIPIGCLLFSVIIFLQQKFGGRCFLPQKLRDLGSYEKVPTVGEEAQLPK